MTRKKGSIASIDLDLYNEAQGGKLVSAHAGLHHLCRHCNLIMFFTSPGFVHQTTALQRFAELMSGMASAQ